MIKNGLLLLSLFLLVGTFHSCLTKKKKPIEITLDLCSVDLFPLNNTLLLPQIATTDTVPAKAFGFRIDLNYIHPGNICQISPFETFSLLPSCYATDPVQNTVYLSSNPIDSVWILANNAFDADHPAGTDVKAFFSIFKKYGFESVNAPFSGDNRYLELQSEYDFPMKEQFDLLLMKTPENPGDFQFTVRIFMKNGEIREESTSFIHLSL